MSRQRAPRVSYADMKEQDRYRPPQYPILETTPDKDTASEETPALPLDDADFKLPREDNVPWITLRSKRINNEFPGFDYFVEHNDKTANEMMSGPTRYVDIEKIIDRKVFDKKYKRDRIRKAFKGKTYWKQYGSVKTPRNVQHQWCGLWKIIRKVKGFSALDYHCKVVVFLKQLSLLDEKVEWIFGLKHVLKYHQHGILIIIYFWYFFK